MPSLQLTTSLYAGMILVEAVGDVDLATSDTLWDELSAHLAPASTVALVCTGITFIDSMGLQALMRTRRQAAEKQASFVLIGANEKLDKVLELTGLADLIPRFRDVDAARAELAVADS